MVSDIVNPESKNLISLDVNQSHGRERLDLIVGMRGLSQTGESRMTLAPPGGDLLDDTPAPTITSRLILAFNQKSSH